MSRFDQLRRMVTLYSKTDSVIEDVSICRSCSRGGSGEFGSFCNENMDTPHKHVVCAMYGTVHPIYSPDICEEYKDRYKVETRSAKYTAAYIHDDIVGQLIHELKKNHWSCGGISSLYQPPTAPHLGFPDIVARKFDNTKHSYKLFEVKPLPKSNNRIDTDEIKRGLGQCMVYLLYSPEVYLVVHSVLFYYLMPILTHSKLIGLVLYDTQPGYSNILLFNVAYEPEHYTGLVLTSQES